MKKLMQYFPALTAAMLIAVLTSTQTAFAQDTTQQILLQQQQMQAAQQASQQAQQQMQQAQQAAQQAQQAVNNASQNSTSQTTRYGVLPPVAPQTPGGPLPAQIAAAHKILLTNVGTSVRLAVDSNTLYNAVHGQLAAWGYYQLVSTPQDADLIFQLDEIDPHSGGNVTAATDYYDRTPTFRIVIVEAKTGVPLWTVTSPIYMVGGKKSAYWIGLSEQNLISRLKVLANQPLTADEQAALTKAPASHRSLALWVAVGAFAAASVGGALWYEHSVNNAKAQQDAFCKANNIPLSECAGG